MKDSDQERALRLAPPLAAIRDELILYENLLRKWQRKINLVGASTLEAVWTRHFADSAQVLDFAPLAAQWVDLGSGAGFPGMVIALVQAHANSGVMHLIESDTRKAAFLREVSRETGARAVVHCGRCEDVLRELAPRVITSRAMTSLPVLVQLSYDHVQKGAMGVFLKGRDIASELTEFTTSSMFNIEATASKIDPSSNVICIRAVHPH
jgi:16S rRNA (guanine527-N7)-methyltransferase